MNSGVCVLWLVVCSKSSLCLWTAWWECVCVHVCVMYLWRLNVRPWNWKYLNYSVFLFFFACISGFISAPVKCLVPVNQILHHNTPETQTELSQLQYTTHHVSLIQHIQLFKWTIREKTACTDHRHCSLLKSSTSNKGRKHWAIKRSVGMRIHTPSMAA